MVYIKVLCGIGNFSGDPFIRFQPTVSCNTKMRFTKSKSRGLRRVVAGLGFCHHRFPTVAKAFKANKGQVEAIKMKDSSHKARIIHWGGINLI